MAMNKLEKIGIIIVVVGLLLVAGLVAFATTKFGGPKAVVAAASSGSASTPPVMNTGPAPGTWLDSTAKFLGLGDKWAVIITSLIVIMIIIASLFDILTAFSLFKGKYTSFILALAVGVIAGVAGLPLIIAAYMLSLVAILGVIGVFVGIVVPIFIFIGLNIMYLSFSRKALAGKITEAENEGVKALSEGLSGLKQIGNAVSEAGQRRMQQKKGNR